MKTIRIVRLAFLLSVFAISLPRGFAQGGTPVFVHRDILQPTEAFPRAVLPESKPIPRGWVIAWEGAMAVIGAVVIFASAKSWRSSNLFGRQYRFPSSGPAALRFGGNRSGGHMAAIEPAKSKEDA